MSLTNSKTFTSAAILIAAFFFHSLSFANLKVNFVQGKIESIENTAEDSVSIRSIKLNELLPYNQLVCTAKGSRAEFGLGEKILRLMLLLKTCRLINAFPDPLDTFGRISLSVYSQELKLKGKYNALIGDAPTDTNLQVWSFDDETQKE